jgi:flagellar FliJ protein
VKRAQRLDLFRDGLESARMDCELRLAAADRGARAARARLEELERYRQEYLRGLPGRAASGMQGQSLRDYQAFIARLGEAIRQQAQLVARCDVEREFERTRWQEAATQAKAVETVVDRWNAEDRIRDGRAEQRESDEFARDIAIRREHNGES